MELDQPRVSWNPEQFPFEEKPASFDNDFILHLVSCFDSVFFDFSDWSVEELNENTSAFFGVPSGSLSINWCDLQEGGRSAAKNMHDAVITADSSDSEPGKNIVTIHNWCVQQAKAEGPYKPGQRCFRFRSGKYAGSLPFPGLRAEEGPRPGSCNPM